MNKINFDKILKLGLLSLNMILTLCYAKLIETQHSSNDAAIEEVQFEEEGTFSFPNQLHIGSGWLDGELANPVAVAVDSTNNVYVVDTLNHRVQKFSASGQHILSFGSYGFAQGQFNYPISIAIDQSNHIYIGESGRVQKFDSNGNHVFTISSYGNAIANQYFYSPTCIAVDSNYSVYIVDTIYKNVKKFDSNGGFIFKFDGTSGSHELTMPTMCGLNSNGDFYVSDPPMSRTTVIDSNGNFIKNIGAFSNEGLALNSNNDIYFYNSSGVLTGNQITKVNSNGDPLSQFQTLDILINFALSIRGNGLAVAPNGDIFIVRDRLHQVERYNSSGQFLNYIGSRTAQQSGATLYFPTATRVDRQGNVYVLDQMHSQVKKFSQSGNLIMSKTIDQLSTQSVDIQWPFATDKNSNWYLIDPDNSIVSKYDSNGQLILQFGQQGSGPGQLSSPRGVVINNKNQILITDNGNSRIVKFDTSGNYLGQFGQSGSRLDNDDLTDPRGIDIDKHGNIYVATNGLGVVKKFTPEGQFIKSIGYGVITGPTHVAVIDNDQIATIGFGDQSVTVTDQNNQLIRTFGGVNPGSTQFWSIKDISSDFSGNIYITLRNLGRVLKFDSTGNYIQ